MVTTRPHRRCSNRTSDFCLKLWQSPFRRLGFDVSLVPLPHQPKLKVHSDGHQEPQWCWDTKEMKATGQQFNNSGVDAKQEAPPSSVWFTRHASRKMVTGTHRSNVESTPGPRMTGTAPKSKSKNADDVKPNPKPSPKPSGKPRPNGPVIPKDLTNGQRRLGQSASKASQTERTETLLAGCGCVHGHPIEAQRPGWLRRTPRETSCLKSVATVLFAWPVESHTRTLTRNSSPPARKLSADPPSSSA